MSAAGDIGKFAILLVILGLVMSSFLGAVVTTSSDTLNANYGADITDGTEQIYQYGNLTSLDVNQTLGDSADFSGASNSQLDGTVDIPHDETWSVSVWAQPDQNRTQRLMQVDGWLFIDLNNSTGTPQWRVTFYDARDWETHTMSANATDTGNWTHLVVRGNATTMTLSENRTQVASDSLATADGTIPTGIDNWDGQVEEFRSYDVVINESVEQTLFDTPVEQTAVTPTARIYFDDVGSEQPVFYRDVKLTLSNAGYADGFAGEPAVEGTDWRLTDRTIEVIDGGSLDGQPAAWVQYTITGVPPGYIVTLVEGVRSAIGLATIGMVVIAAVFVVRLIDDF